jgi:hypothetical protein
LGQLPGGWSGAVSAPAIDRMRASAASAAQDRLSKRASPSQINAPQPRELNHVTGGRPLAYGSKTFSLTVSTYAKSQPQMNCGTHIITAALASTREFTGSEPFACISMRAPAGPNGYTAMDIPHNTTGEIK